MVMVLASSPCGTARAAPAGLPAELQQAVDAAAPDAWIPVIVQFRAAVDGTTLRDTMRANPHAVRRKEVVRRLVAQADANGAPITALGRSLGAQQVSTLWVANAVAMQVHPAQLASIANHPDVASVRLDSVMSAPIAYPGLPLPAEWNIAMIDAPLVWARGFRGKDVVVASLDSGVDARHPDLASRYRGGTNSWFDPHGEHATPADTSGHGTQVMGLMVGGDAGGTHVGIAPEARWIAARIFNDAGDTTESAIHRALQWVLDPDGNPATDDAPDVVNNSWDISAEDGCNTAFQADLDALRAADIAVVFSAGNYGPMSSTSVSPANAGNVVSVGAVDDQRQVALFSSRGPSACDGSLFPQLVAPGEGVLTTDLSFGGTPTYTLVAGTSFSAPHVAGAMALLRSAAPLVSVEQMEQALTATARDVGPAGPDNDSGHGVISVLAALDALPPIDVDGDGYGAGRDCDDRDPTVHPGAVERPRDGKDQDCNGYDLSLQVHYAVYSHDGATLRMRVTSALGAAAQLQITDVGPLTYRAVYGDWIYEGAAGTPASPLTVHGIEGELQVRPRMPTRRR
ncbi:MAG: S8 family serine peptidase [Steroidobacteraceae bacterium]